MVHHMWTSFFYFYFMQLEISLHQNVGIYEHFLHEIEKKDNGNRIEKKIILK